MYRIREIRKPMRVKTSLMSIFNFLKHLNNKIYKQVENSHLYNAVLEYLSCNFLLKQACKKYYKLSKMKISP